jgi:hypothetical protein
VLTGFSLAGLDIATRGLVLSLLQSLHVRNAPHFILGMRPQDPIPEWTTHLALIREDGTVHTGHKEEVLAAAANTKLHPGWTPPEAAQHGHNRDSGEVLASLAGVNVAYSDRKVELLSSVI